MPILMLLKKTKIKRNILLPALFAIAFSFSIQAQDVSCRDLMDYVKANGYRKGEVNSMQLMQSSWLTNVTAWKVDGVIAVVAEIKRDEWGFNTDEYIFCGISTTNWDAFYWGTYDHGLTYGERFHKYVIDHRCNCY